MNDITHFQSEKPNIMKPIYGLLFINFLLLVLNLIFSYFIYDELTGFVIHF